MPLIVLEEAMKPVYKAVDKLDFAELIRSAREAVGLKGYKAAEFMGISPARLKNLETGYFRVMPTEAELNAIAQLYDLKLSTIKVKAKEHVNERERAKKVKLNA